VSFCVVFASDERLPQWLKFAQQFIQDVRLLNNSRKINCLALHDLAERNGHEIVAEYTDHGVSGVASKKRRSKKMLLDAKAKKFSVHVLRIN
jgi:hypothetical protein